MKYYVRTYGCQMNVADSDEMARHLRAKGLVPTEDQDEAQLLLVNQERLPRPASQRIGACEESVPVP